MNQREFRKYLDRDGSSVATGKITDDLVPNHRRNRGMGGSKTSPSDIVIMESGLNGDLESSATSRAAAIYYGWKLESWQDPTEEPFYHVGLRRWVQPDNSYGLTPVPIPARVFNVPKPSMKGII